MADNTGWGMTNYEWAQLALGLMNTTIAAMSAYDTHKAAKKSRHAQREAEELARQEQAAADKKAETQRLEALATNMTTTDYANVWGLDNAKYADAAQKLSAGTGSFNEDEDETNPFYSRGLL